MINQGVLMGLTTKQTHLTTSLCRLNLPQFVDGAEGASA